MPPKRKAANDDDQKPGPSRRGRGKGTTTRAPPKKKTNPKDYLMILIDAGSESTTQNSDGKSTFKKSKELADWIISRKIFADSDTYINVGVYPASSMPDDDGEVVENTKFFLEEFQKPTIGFLKKLDSVIPNTGASDVLQSLEGAVQMIEKNDVSSEDNVGIAVLSNCFGTLCHRNRIKDVIDTLNSYNITLSFIRDDPDAKYDPFSDVFEEFRKQCQATSESFENALNTVSYFAPKPKAIRGQPFQLQLSESFKIDLQLFVKVSEEKFIPKFNQVTDDNEQVSKIRQYEQVLDEVKMEDEPMMDSDPRMVIKDKGELIKGYHYGTSIIPFSAADKELAMVGKEGKQLQLVMFTKEENILPHYLMSSCRWLIPNKKSESASRSAKALVEGMKRQGTVAIVRYAYNAVSNPRLAVLFPKLTKNGCPVFEHFTLPFNEDFRGFEFPSLDKIGEDPTDYQIDTMESYIDHFMLTKEIKNENGKKEKIERMKINEIRNPQTQQICMSIKRKALGLPQELDEEEHKALLQMVSPPKDILESSEKIKKILAKSFDLKIVEKTEEAGIFNKSLAEFKVDFDGEMKPPMNYDEMKLGDLDDY